MKRKISFLSMAMAVLMLFSTSGWAKKIADLPELMRPAQFSIGLNRIFVSEGTTIYVYSLEDFKLIKKFGKTGEGPQEFKISQFGTPMVVYPYKNKLYISSDAKVSQFTIDGKFINEAKVPPFQVYRPFVNNSYIYTGTTVVKNMPHLSISLANEKFEKTKELYVSDMTVGPNASFTYPLTPIDFEVHENLVFVPTGGEKFVIDVFNEKGSKLYSIQKEFKPVKVGEAYKKATLEWFKTAPNFKNFWEFFKNRISFRDHYPAIQTMTVDDGKLYVITHKKKKNNSLCLIFDLNGKLIKEVYVHVPPLIGMDFYAKFSFYKGAYYLLMENEDDEVWELFKTQLIK